MEKRTVELDEEAYERLEAERREGESFSDVIKRLTETENGDWRDGFGKYADESEDLVEHVRRSREQRGRGRTTHQRRTLDVLDSSDDSQ